MESPSLDRLQLDIARRAITLATRLLELYNGHCTHPDRCHRWAIVRHAQEGGVGWPGRVRYCSEHFEEDRDGELDLRRRGMLRSNRPHGSGPWIPLPHRAELEALAPSLVAWESCEDARENWKNKGTKK